MKSKKEQEGGMPRIKKGVKPTVPGKTISGGTVKMTKDVKKSCYNRGPRGK